ncbi:MAG: MerR family transcriptional regulator [Pseudonocardiales bacterium]
MSTALRSGPAAGAGVNLQTLRYYERRGLISEPDRTAGGQRGWPAGTVVVLRVIRAAHRTGFALDEIADLLISGAHRHGRRAAPGLPGRARATLAETEQRLADLEVICDTLSAAVAAGCEDLRTCAESPCCPLPYEALATDRPSG